jgi:hypothetical protein
MKTSPRFTRFCLQVLVSATAGSAEAYTWQNPTFTCTGVPSWTGSNPPTNHPMRYPCYNQSSVPNFSSFQDATAWAYWMWVRDGQSTAQLYLDLSSCDNRFSGSSNGAWFQWYDTNADVWYDTSTNVSELSGNTIGYTKYTYTPAPWVCPLVPGYPQLISEMDIAIRTDWNWSGRFAVNTINDCLTLAIYVEQLALHEVGHAYGMNHFDAWMATMNTFLDGSHHCNVGSGFHTEPYADDSQAMMSRYRKNAGTVRNLSAIPFAPDMNGVTNLDPLNIMGNVCSTVTVQQKLSYFNHYDAVTSFPMRFELYPSSVTNPIGVTPTFAGTTSYWSGGQAGATYGVNMSVQVPHTALTPGVQYRVWIRVDPHNTYVESDEGDNFVPFRTFLTRDTRC